MISEMISKHTCRPRPRHRGGGGPNEKGELLPAAPGAPFCFLQLLHCTIHVTARAHTQWCRHRIVKLAFGSTLLLHDVAWSFITKASPAGDTHVWWEMFLRVTRTRAFLPNKRCFQKFKLLSKPPRPPPPESTHRIVRVCGHSCRREVCAPAPLGAAELAAALDEDSLAELLHPVSLARTKARRRRA